MQDEKERFVADNWDVCLRRIRLIWQAVGWRFYLKIRFINKGYV